MLRLMQENRRARFVLLTGLAIVLLQLKLSFFFFVVPLHVLYRKDGRRDFLLASVVVVAVTIAIVARRVLTFEDQGLRTLILLMELAVPVMFLAGIYVMLDGAQIRIPGIYRYLLALAGPGFVGFLVFSKIFAYQPLVEIMQELSQQMGGLFASTYEVQGGMDEALMWDFFQSPELWAAMEETFLRTWLLGFSVLILLCWRMGESVMAFSRRQSLARLVDFRVPHRLLWPFLLLWAVVGIQIFFPMPVLRYPLWNAGLVLLFLYGLQGLGLLRYLADKRRIPRGMQFLGMALLVVLFMKPIWNTVVIIGIPALGLSEHWVIYRK